jgi:hypothetical protein
MKEETASDTLAEKRKNLTEGSPVDMPHVQSSVGLLGTR